MIKNNPQNDAAKQEIIEGLLKDLPSDTAVAVDLPSEARVYELEDPDMPITLRPMTFEDEKCIVNSKKEEDPINLILQRCITNIKIL